MYPQNKLHGIVGVIINADLNPRKKSSTMKTSNRPQPRFWNKLVLDCSTTHLIETHKQERNFECDRYPLKQRFAIESYGEPYADALALYSAWGSLTVEKLRESDNEPIVGAIFNLEYQRILFVKVSGIDNISRRAGFNGILN